ncbi:M15 family metallopeptidase, partial [Cellulomonas hominis]
GGPRPEPAAPRRTGPGSPGSPGTPPAPRPRPAGSTPPRRPATQHGRLRPTPLGWTVLAVAAALVVAVVVGVVRLVAGPAAEAVVPACEPDATQSQNCWPAITDNEDPRLEPSPWITGRVLGGDVRTVLDHVAQRFDAEVEPVDVASSWGWAYRSVRGEDEALSNHASGTSIDLNATEHPLGSSGTFTDDQVAAIRAILAEVSPVVAWGGDFDGRLDEMHFEIVGDAEAVAEVAARLRGEPAAG